MRLAYTAKSVGSRPNARLMPSQDRTLAMRDDCRAAIDALHADGKFATAWTPARVTDTLWTMLLVPNWENLTIECGWSTQQ